jgi:uncharacterized protein (TIGR03083 family)
MMAMATVAVARSGRIHRAEAPALASAEYGRFLDLVRTLRDDDWGKPTDCTRWDVRGIVAHVLGWAETLTMREFMRVQRLGKPVARELGVPLLDGMNEVLVRQRADVSPAELLTRLERAAPKAVAARASVPAPMRLLPVSTPNGRINLGFLNDHIYTRDLFIHRVDITRATGSEMVVTADHDARIVADVVADWTAAHRQPFALVLDGPAGGRFTNGVGGEEHRLDAVEFCRIVSGRAAGTELLATPVLF